MRAKDIMTTEVVTVNADTQVTDIVTLLLEKHLSVVPVVDANQAVIGIVSESDLMHRAEIGTDQPRSRVLAFFHSSDQKARDYIRTHGLSARDVMSKPPITVHPDAELLKVVHTMDKRRVKKLPVVEGGRLVGIVSRGDLLRALAARQKQLVGAPAENDTGIRNELIKIIRKEDWASVAMLDVDVVDGVVHFWGILDNEDQREAMHIAAKRIPGVTRIEDHLSRGIPSSGI